MIEVFVLKAMAAAGASIDMILTVLEADQKIELEHRAAKREADRNRKQKQRLRHAETAMSRGQTGTSRDIEDTDQALVSTSNEAPQDVASAATTGVTAQTSPDTQKRKVSPHPSKEKQPLQEVQQLFDDEGRQERKYSEVPRARATKGSRLPDDWLPSLDDLTFARTLLVAERVQLETEKFRDYWHARAGPGAVKTRWSATWRNWCRKASEDGKSNGNGKHKQSLGDAGAELFREAKSFERAHGIGRPDDTFGGDGGGAILDLAVAEWKA